jgi:uncharacterized repeat protein (TIGR03803 family)
MQRSYSFAAACTSAALLAACSGNSLSSSVPSSATLPLAAQAASSPPSPRSLPSFGRDASHRVRKNVQLETVLYSFLGGTDGDEPSAQLTNVGGTLYGTSYGGGASNDGTVFAITPSGAYNQLYSFTGGSDGATPVGRLVNVGGTLYGTTIYGGASNVGTFFSITTSGTETVLHSFAGSDGQYPEAGLIYVGTKLYGSTYHGGASNDGTVFKITTSGTETVLHSFVGSDGSNPTAELLDVGGKLYGTTNTGGSSGDGTVFNITTSGTETVLHNFSGSDGNFPYDEGGLIKVGAKLYGTTLGGGVNNNGTIFNITTAGAFTNLYSFKGGSDAQQPYAGLTNLNGTLFGVTPKGGGVGCVSYPGCGAIFALLPNGPEIVVYSFTGGSDGDWPNSALTNVNGTLFGITNNHDTNDLGTVFSLTF